MAHVIASDRAKKNNNKKKMKNTKIKIKCVGGGGQSSQFALSDL